jgi:hypothetical protein
MINTENMNTKHIELAKKLKALADKGIGGEKINAEKMLNSLLKKHNLTIEDIEGEKIEKHYFKLEKKDERLWAQIVKSVNNEIKCYGPFPIKMIKEYHFPGNYLIECTISEYIEIEAKNNIYKRLYEEESNIFYHAFCTANNILIKPKKSIDISDLEVNELQTLLRVRQMSRNIKNEQYRKQLN